VEELSQYIIDAAKDVLAAMSHALYAEDQDKDKDE
jgi:hypothetical protein